jgi:hypothetical protein
MRGTYRILVGKRKGKRPLGRPTRRWVDNIKIYLKGAEWDVYGLLMAQDKNKWRAFVNAVMNLRVP